MKLLSAIVSRGPGYLFRGLREGKSWHISVGTRAFGRTTRAKAQSAEAVLDQA